MLDFVLLLLYITSFGWNADEALAIAHCESRFEYEVVSETGDYGLFQLNRSTWEDWMLDNHYLVWEDIHRDPFVNTYAAYLAYEESRRVYGYGWEIWSCEASW